MTKTELVAAIAERKGIEKDAVDKSLAGLFEVVAGVVAKGDEKVSIPGFMTIEQKTRSARTARNLHTGETINVPETKTVKISAGSKLKSIVKGDTPAP